MMYHGQYPYMSPYMPYYPQGYMNPDSTARLPYENYFTALNPFAEPWNPGSGHQPSMNPAMSFQDQVKAGQTETCTVCSHRQQEEQRQLKKNLQGEGHTCKLHSPIHRQEIKDGGQNYGPDSNHGANGYNETASKTETDMYHTDETVVSSGLEKSGSKKVQSKQRSRSDEETDKYYNRGMQGQGQKKQPAGHGIDKKHHSHYNQTDEYYSDGNFEQQSKGQKGHSHACYKQGQGQTSHYGNRQEAYYETYDMYNKKKTGSGNKQEINQGMTYDQHGWSTNEDENEYEDDDNDDYYDEDDRDLSPYQHHGEDSCTTQMEGRYGNLEQFHQNVQSERYYPSQDDTHMYYRKDPVSRIYADHSL